MGLNWKNNRIFDYFSPKFSYFDTGGVDFIEISIKSTRNIKNTN